MRRQSLKPGYRSRKRRIGRNLRATGVAASILLLLTSCATSPEFTAPIRWSSASRLVNAESLGPLDPKYLDPNNIVIELEPNGTGSVENLPQGTIGKNPDGNLCLDVSEDGTYTGEITWQPRSEWSLDLRFADSEVILATNPGKFGSQDWGEVRIWPCNLGNAYWRIGVECGSLGDPHDEVYKLEPCTEPG